MKRSLAPVLAAMSLGLIGGYSRPGRSAYVRQPKFKGEGYYKERNATPCPRAPKKLGESQPKQKLKPITHGTLTLMGIPRRKDGTKLGMRKRRQLATK